jgi:hypothetical protein
MFAQVKLNAAGSVAGSASRASKSGIRKITGGSAASPANVGWPFDAGRRYASTPLERDSLSAVSHALSEIGFVEAMRIH